MPLFRAADLRDLGVALFEAVGVPSEDAALVADHMVESGLLGHDSHSVLRFPQYVDMVRDGVVETGVPLQVLQETECTAQVSGGWNYGPVTATAAMQLAIDKARGNALSAVTVRDCNHIARLGRFVALAARENLVALMTSNGHGGDLAVAPFGGAHRRIPTNPLSIAVPTGRDWPVVLDMTTSMISGGALRLHRNQDTPVPAGHIIDADGGPTTDVEEYYGPPPGAMLPLGWPNAGHKGWGLGAVVDVLSGALSGGGCSQAEPPRSGNALFIAVLDVASFIELEEFFAEVDCFIDWVKSSPPAPGFAEVVLPGEKSHQIYQQRVKDGLEVDASAWEQIRALAAEIGVDLPEPVDNMSSPL